MSADDISDMTPDNLYNADCVDGRLSDASTCSVRNCEWCKHGVSIGMTRGSNVRCTKHNSTKKAYDKCGDFDKITMGDIYPIKVKGDALANQKNKARI